MDQQERSLSVFQRKDRLPDALGQFDRMSAIAEACHLDTD